MSSPDSELILQYADIIEVVGQVIPLKKQGINYVGLCPFHNDKNPSMSVSAQKQFFKCFSCDAGGNVIGFVMKYYRLEFPQALKYLADMYHLQLPSLQTNKFLASQQQSNPSNDQEKKKKSEEILRALKQSSELFEKSLKDHPQNEAAINYLKGRGLNGITAKMFNIGFAPNDWHYLQHKISSEFSEEILRLAGLIATKNTINNDKDEKSSKFYDKFRNRIMFPIINLQGDIAGFGARRINESDEPKYLNSSESYVFKKGEILYGLYQTLQKQNHWDRILIVEGYMDVIALAQAQVYGAVATLGTSLSANHVRILLRYTDELIFSFDGDAPGQKAAQRTIDIVLPLLRDGVRIKFMILPEAEDPDSLVKKIGKDKFLQEIKSSTDIVDFLFNIYPSNPNPKNESETALYTKQMTTILSKMPKTWLKTLLFERLSEKTGLPVERLIDIKDLNTSQNIQKNDPIYSNSYQQPTIHTKTYANNKSQYQYTNHRVKSKERITSFAKKNQPLITSVKQGPVRHLIHLLLGFPKLYDSLQEGFLDQVYRWESPSDSYLLQQIIKSIHQITSEFGRAPDSMLLFGELSSHHGFRQIEEIFEQNSIPIGADDAKEELISILSLLKERYDKQNKKLSMDTIKTNILSKPVDQWSDEEKQIILQATGQGDSTTKYTSSKN